MDSLHQLLGLESQQPDNVFRRLGYFSSVLVASVLLVAGLLVYSHARTNDEMRVRGNWQDTLPMVAMAYGSLLLLAVAVIEVRVKHVRSGSLVMRTHTLDELIDHLTRCQEQEREHLSVRLHDDIGGLLAALKLELESADSASSADGEVRSRVDRLLGQLFAEVRSMAALLYPRMIGVVGVKGALSELAGRLRSGKMVVHLDVDDRVDEIDAVRGLCVLRVVQEAIVNANRHAGASQIRVWLRIRGTRVEGTVDDDGNGWQHESEGMGLTLMRERLRRLGGGLELGASTCGGARVTFTLPGEDSAKEGACA